MAGRIFSISANNKGLACPFKPTLCQEGYCEGCQIYLDWQKRIEVSFPISGEGVILETIRAAPVVGNLTITIPVGTVALDKDGAPLSIVTSDVDVSLPPPPERANIIGLAYNFGPAGATFSPAITLEYTYDPAEIPEGVAEEDLVLAYYDEAAGEWVELPSTVDPLTNTITASVSHFTTFSEGTRN